MDRSETGAHETVVLMIDAETSCGETVRRILSQEVDIVCHFATQPDEAVALAKQVGPTVILQNLAMPDIDGLALIERLRQEPATREVPLVALAPEAETIPRAEAFARGVNDYLVKLPDSQELVARVRYHARAYGFYVQCLEIEKHRALSQLVAGIAHDLNTPLGVCRTAADIIASGVKSWAQQDIAVSPEMQQTFNEIVQASDLIQRNAVRAHTLTQQFKKVSADQLSEIREKADISLLVADIVDLFSINARKAGLQIEIEDQLSPDERTWEGYPGYLSQVLLNYLTNIERYAYADNQGGKVEIVLSTTNATDYVLTVRDFGVGIPAEALEKIYEPFFTTGQGRGGTGLGMAIVYNLVTKALQGRIDIQSTPGRGTTIVTTLPRVVSVR